MTTSRHLVPLIVASLTVGVTAAVMTNGAMGSTRPSACYRIMDEGPFLSGTRIVCPRERNYTTRYEDPTDLEWSWVVLDGQYVGIPPDSRVGTWNP